jgi:hypothetical protein
MGLRVGPVTTLSDWKPLSVLESALSRLPIETRTGAVHHIAETMANSAADTKELHDIFTSKLYKFAYQSMAKTFAIKPKSLTDLVVVREADKLRPILLGTEELEGGLPTEFGFHVKNLPEVSLPPPEKAPLGKLEMSLGGETANAVEWKQGKNTYHADVSAVITQTRAATGIYREGFPYPLLSQGGLNGIVITGSNLLQKALPVMQEYRNYYESEGFDFSAPRRVDNLHAYLEEKIQSGETDYLIKEAHSDGDEKNLFRMDVRGEVVVGTKTAKDGTKESVQLIYPTPAPVGEAETRLVSNGEFGSWIQHREHTSKAPLIYFNTSCWSVTKAVNELDAANSPLLLEIPSTNMCYIFSNSKESVLRQMLDSFRKQKSYDSIRAAMSVDEGYKTHKSDGYLLPDEAEYQRRIDKVRQLAVRVNVTITGPDGRRYDLDTAQ